MPKSRMARLRIALNLSLYDDLQRAGLLAGINKVAPQSPLMQNAAIAASVAALQKSGATLANAVTSADESAKVHNANVSARNVARSAFDRDADGLKTLVENNATDESGVKGMGFTLLDLTTASRDTPPVPQGLVTHTPKTRGKPVIVSVAGKGYLGHFAAQATLDPNAASPVYVELPGRGKSRKLTGYPSGTKVWVQFAAIRFNLQSAWSVAAQVTIP